MNEGTDGTIFTTCFALFIFDLFGKIDTWSKKERDLWIDNISSFQDRDSGYFIPDNFEGKLNTKPVQQLTYFCLSALHILGSFPKYELLFLKQWPQSEDVYNYLNNIGCFSGFPTTGNMAMFLAIFLTYQYEKNKDKSALERLNLWFYSHEKTQNSSIGFWGNYLKNKYYAGFQNAFHQFVIYTYWNRPVPYNRKIVDTVMSLQDEDGHFGPIPGGGGCWDFDAADILIHCGYERGYRIKDVETSLKKLSKAILISQNNDGGFCEARKHVASLKEIFRFENLKFIFKGANPYLWYYRLKTMVVNSRKKRAKIYTHWTKEGRSWDQSNLWDTWFRCLTVAEIETVLRKSATKIDWKFHKFIGVGYYSK